MLLIDTEFDEEMIRNYEMLYGVKPIVLSSDAILADMLQQGENESHGNPDLLNVVLTKIKNTLDGE